MSRLVVGRTQWVPWIFPGRDDPGRGLVISIYCRSTCGPYQSAGWGGGGQADNFPPSPGFFLKKLRLFLKMFQYRLTTRGNSRENIVKLP